MSLSHRTNPPQGLRYASPFPALLIHRHRFLIYDNDAIFCPAISQVIEHLGLHPNAAVSSLAVSSRPVPKSPASRTRVVHPVADDQRPRGLEVDVRQALSCKLDHARWIRSETSGWIEGSRTSHAIPAES